ncbi:MAG: hypothetical protein FWG02_02670 [Holophagaceae bacterium]|nr:hypothetical protein [Holophagaceae bacterium]
MDLLRQVEQKIQALVEQRNQLREELDSIKETSRGIDAEIYSLRATVDDLQKQNSALEKERNEVRLQVESILEQLEELA